MNVNRMTEVFARVEAAETRNRKANEAAAEESQLFRDRITEAFDLFADLTGSKAWGLQKKIASRLKVTPETVNRWKNSGLKRTESSAALENFCEIVGVHMPSLWSEELIRTKPAPVIDPPQLLTTEFKFHELKNTGSWPLLVGLIDKLYDAERSTRPAPSRTS